MLHISIRLLKQELVTAWQCLLQSSHFKGKKKMQQIKTKEYQYVYDVIEQFTVICLGFHVTRCMTLSLCLSLSLCLNSNPRSYDGEYGLQRGFWQAVCHPWGWGGRRILKYFTGNHRLGLIMPHLVTQCQPYAIYYTVISSSGEYNLRYAVPALLHVNPSQKRVELL